MDTIEKLVQRVHKTQHGFLDIQKTADEVFSAYTAKESLRLAKQLFVSEIYQARSLATFILGRLAANSEESIAFLKERVSQDNDLVKNELCTWDITNMQIKQTHKLASKFLQKTRG